MVAVVASIAPGCFVKPDRDHGVVTDAPPSAIDASGPPPMIPRVIDKAYYHVMGGTPGGSPGMSSDGFTVKTTGIVDGDLVLFIGSIDNGNPTKWPNPIAAGFVQLDQSFFGSDGQTAVAAWKIAHGEPPTYTNVYGISSSSATATITLLAISGIDPTTPINDFVPDSPPAMTLDVMPTPGVSSGVTPTVGDCTLVYASAADWFTSNGGSNTVEVPTGFTSLAKFGDRGDNSWDYTSEQVAYRALVPSGATGPVVGSLDGTATATAWTALIAIAPAP